MTVSRISLVLAAVLASAPALAQQDSRPEAAPLGQPHLLQPRALGAPAPAGAPPSARPAPVPGGPGIQVDQLQALDVDAGGALSVDEGGLGASLWYGTKRDLVESLLGHLPARAESPALRGLMRRLLLTAAAPPEGKAEPGALMARRLKILTRMGDLEGASALLAAVPSRARTEPMMRLEADTLLLDADAPRACALAANQVQAVDTPYWQKLLAFCQTLAGEGGKAMLGAELLREVGNPDKPFFMLLEALNGVPGSTLDELAEPTPLHVAMARAAKVPLPPEAADGDHPAVLRAIALDQGLPLPMRLKAAERAEVMGALPTLALRDLYSRVPFTAEELANPLSAAGVDGETPPPVPVAEGEMAWDPELRARALLIHTALHQEVDAARAEALSAALHRAQRDGRYPAAARVLKPALETMEPSASHVWLAGDMVRALVIAGEVERAGAWFRLLKGNASLNPESAKAVAQLKPLMFLAGGEDLTAQDLAAWLPTLRGASVPPWSGGRLFALVEGFDLFIPDGLWARVPLDRPRAEVVMPDAALLRRLDLAARRGKIGEAVLLALVALGGDDPGHAHPLVLSQAIKSLRSIGLEDVARGIAVEAAVASLP